MAHLIATGRLGKDAELRKTQNGKSVLSFSLADDIGWGDNKKTQWLKCALWGDRAEKLAPHMLKGSMIEISGTPSVEAWNDKAKGEARAAIVVTVADVRLHGGGKREDTPVADRGRATGRNDMDDEIPF